MSGNLRYLMERGAQLYPDLARASNPTDYSVSIAFSLEHTIFSLHSIVSFQSRLAGDYRLKMTLVNLSDGCLSATFNLENRAEVQRLHDIALSGGINKLIVLYSIVELEFPEFCEHRRIFFKHSSSAA